MRGICRRCLARTEGRSCLGVDIGDECLRAEGPLFATGCIKWDFDPKNCPLYDCISCPATCKRFDSVKDKMSTLTEMLRQKILEDRNSKDAEYVEVDLALIKNVLEEWLGKVGLPDGQESH